MFREHFPPVYRLYSYFFLIESMVLSRAIARGVSHLVVSVVLAVGW